MELIKTFKNTGWTKADIRTIQHKINALWNSYSSETKLYTILVQVISKDCKGHLSDTTHWVDLPKKANWSNVIGIKIFKVEQTPSSI